MATHSSVLAWRIPGTGEPGGLPSMGWHRVRHDWSDAAAAAAAAESFGRGIQSVAPLQTSISLYPTEKSQLAQGGAGDTRETDPPWSLPEPRKERDTLQGDQKYFFLYPSSPESHCQFILQREKNSEIWNSWTKDQIYKSKVSKKKSNYFECLHVLGIVLSTVYINLYIIIIYIYYKHI